MSATRFFGMPHPRVALYVPDVNRWIRYSLALASSVLVIACVSEAPAPPSTDGSAELGRDTSVEESDDGPITPPDGVDDSPPVEVTHDTHSEVGPEDAQPDAPAPSATPTGLTPEDGVTGVAEDAIVALSLSGPLTSDQSASISLVTYPSGEPVAGDASWNTAGDLLSFTPASPLSPAMTYRAEARVDTQTLRSLFTVAPTTAPTLAPLTAAQKDALGATIESALGNSNLTGHTFSGYVFDLTSGEAVYAKKPDAPLIPASNTKVFTTAAALGLLGEEHSFLSRVYSDQAIGPDGTLNGALYLHGQHDFTWSHWFYPSPRFPLDTLAQRLWDAGLRQVNGGVALYGAYCYEGHHFASYSPATHRAKVEVAFVEALQARGIGVSGGVSSFATMDLPPGQVELARWESLPLWVAIWAINRKSHNEMADILNRHIGWMIEGSSDYASGSAAIVAWLDEQGLDTNGLSLNDGSGLSLSNRISGRQLAELYAVMDGLGVGRAWKTSLSVGGAGGPASTDASDVAMVLGNSGPYNGTLAFRMNDPDVAGRFFGKSGTNAGITTSGVLWNRHDGHRYAFGLQMNAISSSVYSSARSVQDSIIAAVAKNIRGVGPRPESPTLTRVEAVAEDGALAVHWTSTEGATGYIVRRWNGTGLYTTHTTFTEVGLNPGQARYFEVRAVAASGVMSEWSDTYGGRLGEVDSPRVVVVDAHDRWQDEPVNENPMGAGHAFIERYVRALGGNINVTSVADEAVPELLQPEQLDAVFWAAGEDSTAHHSIDSNQQAWLEQFVDSGGALMVSGAEVGYDLNAGEDLVFYNQVLHASYVADDSGVYVFSASSGGPFEGLELAGFWTPGTLFVAWSDVIAPNGPGAVEALEYATGETAAIAWDGRVIVLGFPFESVDKRATRRTMMNAAREYFGLD